MKLRAILPLLALCLMAQNSWSDEDKIKLKSYDYTNFDKLKDSTKSDAKRASFIDKLNGDDNYNYLYSEQCTGSVVQFSFEEYPLFMTAKHCNAVGGQVEIRRRLGFKGYISPDKNTSSWNDTLPFVGSPFVSSYYQDYEGFFAWNDLGDTPKYTKNIEILKPTKTRLKMDQKVRIVGFPQAYGPKTLECVYRGREMSNSAIPKIQKHGQHMVQGLLFCPAIREVHIALQGMSGAPVLNEKNEFVGIFHSTRSSDYRTGEDDTTLQSGTIQFTEILDSSFVKGISGPWFYRQFEYDGDFNVVHKEIDGTTITCSGHFDHDFVHDEYLCTSDNLTLHPRTVLRYNFRAQPEGFVDPDGN